MPLVNPPKTGMRCFPLGLLGLYHESRRGHTNTKSRSKAVFDIVMRRILKDQFFFKNIAIATLVVPDLFVFVSRIQSREDSLLFRTHVTVRTKFVDRQRKTIVPDVMVLD